MPVVQMPNGDRVQFPDTMPRDDIRAKILERFPDAMAPTRENADRMEGLKEPEPKGSFLDAVGQGMTLGFADEAVHYAGFPETAATMRENAKAYAERRPWASLGGEVVGGLPLMAVPGLNVARSATLAQAVGKGAFAGAVGGGALGFGQGEGVVDRVVGGAKNAGTGALIGGALPAAGTGLVRGVQRLRGRGESTVAGASPGAQRELDRIVAEGGQTVPEAFARARSFGPDATIMDANSGARAAGEALAQSGRPGGAALEALARRRAQAAPQRINAAFSSVLGNRPAPAEMIEALKRRSQRRAERLYAEAEQAVDGPIQYDPSLQPALNAQRQQMAKERVAAAAAPDNSYEFLRPAQHRISRAKRADEKAAQGAGGSPAVERAAVGRSDEALIVAALDDATGGRYSIARQAYAGDKAAEEAFDYGFRKAMQPSTEISFVRQHWNGLNAEQRVAFRAGVRSWLGQKAGDLRGARGQARNAVREGDAQSKLRVVFGDDVTDRLSNVMEGQLEMGRTDDLLDRASGSRTARTMGSRVNPANTRVNTGMSIPGLMARAGSVVVDQVTDPSRRFAQVAEVLAAQGPQRDAYADALTEAFRRRRARALPAPVERGATATSTSTARAVTPEDVARARRDAVRRLINPQR